MKRKYTKIKKKTNAMKIHSYKKTRNEIHSNKKQMQ